MAVYLHDIPLPQAQSRLLEALRSAGLAGVLGIEEIALDERAVGRTLAEAVWARISSPHYHSAAMDGFALRAGDSARALPSRPVELRVGEGAGYVDTGDPLPDWADAVVPVENIEALDAQGRPAADPRRPETIRLREALAPWANVRPMGEDIVATELVLPAGRTLRPVDLGAAAAGGQTGLWVARKPRVGVLPTGSELIPVGQPEQRGDIIEYNSIVLAAQVLGWGGEAQRFPITPDDLDLLRSRVQTAADTCDLVLLNAGSSAGSEDYSARIVSELGELLVHGVAVRPGHPVILGMLRRSQGGKVPVIGVPGYPVSAALTGEIFVEPLLALWSGRASAQAVEVEAAITRKITSPGGDDDFVRVVAGWVDGRLLAAPLSRGAGVISSLARADGIVLIPRGVQGLEAGAKVRVRLYCAPAELARTLLAIGSHDMTLDILAQYLGQRGRRLVSSNAGSMGGLAALRRGEAHLAGSHLLDPQSGEYNCSYIRQYLDGSAVTQVDWVGRTQGLLVARGNPKGITGLVDLSRGDICFVNRQRGAGTRVLLDYQLSRLGIQADQVRGYEQEEYTHLAVAAAVSSGRGDCGLGVMAAASALGLDFMPLFAERYQLVVPTRFYESDLFAPLRDLMGDADFRRAVERLDGYDISRMGQIVAQYG
jgi:putative molybdopterin biosynthesis protein